MNKSLTVLLAAVSGAIGFGAGSIAEATPAAPTMKLINTKLVRIDERLPDGGMSASWLARSCGYVMPSDGGTRPESEPCWESRISGTLFAPVEQALIKR